MANCHDLFQIYVDRITPGQAKQQYLRDSRDAIRDKIRKHFKDELKRSQPRFWGQGSYAMKTLIVPLSGEYDIDDGVNLPGEKERRECQPRCLGQEHALERKGRREVKACLHALLTACTAYGITEGDGPCVLVRQYTVKQAEQE